VTQDPWTPSSPLAAPEIAFVRDQVPEFEFAFQEELRSAEGEMSAFQAMSLLAAWVGAQVEVAEEVPTSVQRAFAAVEHVHADHQFRSGGDLGVELLETIGQHPAARASALSIGLEGRKWLLTFCPRLPRRDGPRS